MRNGPGDFDAHLGARGLSQEKSLVTGLSVGVAATKEYMAGGGGGHLKLTDAPLAVEPDETHILAAKSALRAARSAGLVDLLVE